MSASVAAAWASAHLYVQCPIWGARFDRLMIELVAPLAEAGRYAGMFGRFFVVRYEDPHPHIRFRMESADSTSRGEVQRWMEHMIARWCDSAASEPVELKWVPYEPEVNRYGGPDAMDACESFFHCSSLASLEVLQLGAARPRTWRLGQVLLAHVIIAYCAFKSKPEAAALLGHYARAGVRMLVPAPLQQAGGEAQWVDLLNSGFALQSRHLSAFVSSAWDRLCANESVTGALDSYVAGAHRITETLRGLSDRGALVTQGHARPDWPLASRQIVGSLMHMTSNRLGIARREEAYLGYLAARTLAGLETS